MFKYFVKNLGDIQAYPFRCLQMSLPWAKKYYSWKQRSPQRSFIYFKVHSMDERFCWALWAKFSWCSSVSVKSLVDKEKDVSYLLQWNGSSSGKNIIIGLEYSGFELFLDPEVSSVSFSLYMCVNLYHIFFCIILSILILEQKKRGWCITRNTKIQKENLYLPFSIYQILLNWLL